jgi:hypothetical protein
MTKFVRLPWFTDDRVRVALKFPHGAPLPPVGQLGRLVDVPLLLAGGFGWGVAPRRSEAQPAACRLEHVARWTRGGERQLDATDADGDQRADLE